MVNTLYALEVLEYLRKMSYQLWAKLFKLIFGVQEGWKYEIWNIGYSTMWFIGNIIWQWSHQYSSYIY